MYECVCAVTGWQGSSPGEPTGRTHASCYRTRSLFLSFASDRILWTPLNLLSSILVHLFLGPALFLNHLIFQQRTSSSTILLSTSQATLDFFFIYIHNPTAPAHPQNTTVLNNQTVYSRYQQKIRMGNLRNRRFPTFHGRL